MLKYSNHGNASDKQGCHELLDVTRAVGQAGLFESYYFISQLAV